MDSYQKGQDYLQALLFHFLKDKDGTEVLNVVQGEFNGIINDRFLDTDEKNVMYAQLMSILEYRFSVPIFNAERYERMKKEQPYIIHLYETISNSRVWDEEECV